MEAKYTPGPWEAIGNLVRSPTNAGGGVMLAECSDRWFQKVNSEEAKANALLVAAAPELLDVADAIYKFLGMAGCEAVEDSINPAESLRYKAGAAIAKATGGAA